jgi:hypothetical protein
MEVSGQLHFLAALPQGESPRYPLDRRLSVLQSRSGRGGEEKNSHPPPGLKPLIVQPVAQRYTAGLSRLLGIADKSHHPRKKNSMQKYSDHTSYVNVEQVDMETPGTKMENERKVGILKLF